MSKEEIEKAKEDLKDLRTRYLSVDYSSSLSQINLKNLDILFQYIDQLEQENKHYKEFIVATGGKDIENITATKYMKIKQEGYIQGRIEEQDKLLKCINKQNKIIDEMVNLLGSLKLSKDIQGYEIMEKEDWKQYFEKKVEEK